jgi:hypothetical protein
VAAWKALRTHFSTTLRELHQPHTFDSKMEFLRPLMLGNFICIIEDIKVGKQFTVTRITISQNGKMVMVGHATNMDMDLPAPKDVEIKLKLRPVPPPIDFDAVSRGSDPNWILYRRRYFPDAVLKSWTHVDKVLPINARSKTPLAEMWLRPANPKARFTNYWLTFVADHWMRPGEGYVAESLYSNAGIVKAGMRQRNEGWYDRRWDAAFDLTHVSSGYEGARLWPTMNMSLEIRKLLPEAGLEWLFVRTEAKIVENRRTTTEIVIGDVDMEVFAINYQIGLVVPHVNDSSALSTRIATQISEECTRASRL